MPPSAARSPLALLLACAAITACSAITACAPAPTPAPAPPAPSITAARSADTATLRKCCAALAQSADTLTPPKAMYAGAAADRCQRDVASVKTEQDQDHLIATIRGELRGSPMPKECD